jgi:para-nitrobenzyl esterase
MPAAAGLFRRAILHSMPGTFFTTDLADDIAAEVAAELGRAPRAAELADVAPDDLVAAAATVTGRIPERADRWGALAYTPTPFSPVVDGDALPITPCAALAGGAARDIELLVGHTRDEFGQLAARMGEVDDAAADAMVDRLSPTPGARQHRLTHPGLCGRDTYITAMSDWLVRMPTLHLAEAALAGGARVWLYELLWGFGPRGATHSLDTLLVYGTADADGEITAAGPEKVAQAEKLSELMRAEHLAFAATGDPGWTPYELNTRRTRVYDADSTVARYPEERSRTLWRDLRFGALDLVDSGSS